MARSAAEKAQNQHDFRGAREALGSASRHTPPLPSPLIAPPRPSSPNTEPPSAYYMFASAGPRLFRPTTDKLVHEVPSRFSSERARGQARQSASIVLSRARSCAAPLAPRNKRCARYPSSRSWAFTSRSGPSPRALGSLN
jgi:hypothetical protein